VQLTGVVRPGQPQLAALVTAPSAAAAIALAGAALWLRMSRRRRSSNDRTTPASSRTLSRCSIVAERSHSELLVAVADTGAGITADALPRVFDRYFTKGGKHGTGLGLHIAQRVAETAHHPS
jgi:signal transduction histidine kinase